MRSRGRQFDVAHTLTAYFSLGHFNAALLTNHTTVFQALVFAAQALIVFYRPEDTGTEQTIALWLKSTVVNGFWLFHFTKRPGTDHVWRSQRNFDRIKLFGLSLRFQKLK